MGIGLNNELLWHISEDLRRFKRLTYGKTVVMGRKTWKSLPVKPLPGRRNIVITDLPAECFEGAETAYSIKDALDKSSGDEEVFIIGGGSIYHQFMPIADRLYITLVHRRAEADVFFPRINQREWKIVSKEEFGTDKNIDPYTYIIMNERGNILKTNKQAGSVFYEALSTFKSILSSLRLA
jgi:dihydrofolate reductase